MPFTRSTPVVPFHRPAWFRLLLLLLVTACGCPVTATLQASGAVSRYELLKTTYHTQTGGGSPQLDTAEGFGFSARIVGSDFNMFTDGVVVLPNGQRRIPDYDGYTAGVSGLFDSSAELDVAFPPGSYELTVETLDDGLVSATLALPPGSGPAPARVSNIQELLSAEDSAATTLRWDAIPGALATDQISVFVPNGDDDHTLVGVGGQPLGGLATSVVIPAGVLKIDDSDELFIEVRRTLSVDTRSIPGATGRVAVATLTRIPLKLSESAGLLAEVALVKSQHFAQSAGGELALDAEEPFSFAAAAFVTAPGQVAAATFSGPRTGTEPMEEDSVRAGFSLDASFATSAEMDALFPTGFYGISISGSFGSRSATTTFGVIPYPNAPRLLNPSALVGVDSSKDLVLEWEPFQGGTADDMIFVWVLGGIGATLYETPTPGEAGVLNGLARSVTIPRGALTNATFTLPNGSTIIASNLFAAITFAKVGQRTADPTQQLRLFTAAASSTSLQGYVSQSGGGGGATGPLRGRLTSDGQTPLAGVPLQLFSNGSANSQRATTLADGSFEFSRPSTSSSIVLDADQATAASLVPATYALSAADLASDRPVSIVIPRTSRRVNGTFVLPPQTTLQFRVDAASTNGSMLYRTSQQSSADGKFTIPISTGAWTLSLNNTLLDLFGYEPVAPIAIVPGTVDVPVTIQLVRKTASVLNIGTTVLPEAAVGVSYQTQLTTRGGTTPFVWSLTQPGALPGFTLSAAGVLSGTPTAAGQFPVSVSVRDGTGATATTTLTLTVVQPGQFSFAIEREVNFFQATDDELNPSPNNRYAFWSYVDAGDPATLNAVRMTGPTGQAAALTRPSSGRNWTLNEVYQTPEAMNAARPDGNYTFVVEPRTGNSSQTSGQLRAAPYPGPAYLLTSFAVLGDVDATKELIFFADTEEPIGAYSYVGFEVRDATSKEVVFAEYAATDTFDDPDDFGFTIVLEPDTLASGRSYIGSLLLYREVPSGPVINGVSTGATRTVSRNSFNFASAQEGAGSVAGRITLKSDASTQSAITSNPALLNAGITRGLAFGPATVGALGSTVAPPQGSPANTVAVNVSPQPGQSGFVRILFTLPERTTRAEIDGRANVDDLGRVFLNGTPLTPSMDRSNGTPVGTTGDTRFRTDNSSLFRIGLNELLVAVQNTAGGSSGAAFHATVKYEVTEIDEDSLPPFILLDPLGGTLEAGDDGVLEVIAIGDEPLRFQWQFNGRDIPGATEDFLVLEEATAADAGVYTVVVSNPRGSVTSRGAEVRVLVPFEITQQPEDVIVAPGGTATFRVTAAGAGPFTYQWQKNGENIRGANDPTLTINNVRASDSGLYSVTVEGPTDAEDSDFAFLEVDLNALPFSDLFAGAGRLTAAQGVGRASNRNARKEAGEPDHAGDTGGRSIWITLVSPLTGVATMSTEGSSIDTLLAVYTGSAVNALTPVASNDDDGDFFASAVRFNVVAGQEYRVAVDGFDGEDGDVVLGYSIVASTSVIPIITLQPQSLVLREGSTANLRITAVNPPPGTGTLTYQWFQNGTAVAGATQPTYTIPAVQSTHLGLYYAEVRNGQEVVRSDFAFLEVNVPERDGTLDDARSEDKFSRVFVTAPQGAGAVAPQRFKRKIRPGGGVASGYSGTQVFSTYGSSTETGEPSHCGVIGGASQWFSYRAESDGVLTITTDGSDFDTVLAIYNGQGDSFATLTFVVCDNNGGTDGRDSAVRFQARAGTTYFIAVDGVGGATGNVRLSYNLTPEVRLTASQALAGQLQLRVLGNPGARYTILSSTNMVDWSPMITTNAQNGTIQITETGIQTGTRKFYRARLAN